eukprot:3544692-Prymnesium_polylepis.1
MVQVGVMPCEARELSSLLQRPQRLVASGVGVAQLHRHSKARARVVPARNAAGAGRRGGLSRGHRGGLSRGRSRGGSRVRHRRVVQVDAHIAVVVALVAKRVLDADLVAR